jgi:DNA adenine methylase
MKTPLRYPGGKSRAVKTIMEFIPADCGELCSPFLGGGSIELAVAERGTKVHAYDIFKPLVWFWESLLSTPRQLAEAADSYRVLHDDYEGKRGLLKEDFHRIREELRAESAYSLDNAAKFYAINRSSFSGATFSGGFSKRASYARFTDSSIDRVRNFKEPNLTVAHASFKDSIPQHPDAFLYLDPPYMLGETKDKLYGDSGDTHAGFDHQGLHDILCRRSGWLMSYNNCEEIRSLYKDYEIIEVVWAMGMKNVIPPEVTAAKQALVELKSFLEENQLFLSSLPHIDGCLEQLKKPQGSSSEILIIG